MDPSAPSAPSGQNPSDPLESKLRDIILSKIENDKLALPSMPAVAATCLSMLRAPRVDLLDVAREAERDPIVVAYILRLANSAALRAQVAAGTLSLAVTRLGANNLRSLFIHMSTRALFESRDPRITKAFLQIWRHSVAVAILARDLAAVMGNVDANIAYESGLLHDVGKPIIAMLLLQFEKTAGTARKTVGLDSNVWLSAIQSVHRHAAAALARKWNLPQTIQETIDNCSEYHPDKGRSAANLVRFTNAVTKKLGIYSGEFDEEETAMLIVEGRSILGIQEAVVNRVAVRLDQRVDELVAY